MLLGSILNIIQVNEFQSKSTVEIRFQTKVFEYNFINLTLYQNSRFVSFKQQTSILNEQLHPKLKFLRKYT